jgi:hypothetical protein
MSVRLPVNVRHRDDAENGERDDARGNTPTTISLGGNVAIDVVRHALNVIEIGTGAKG